MEKFKQVPFNAELYFANPEKYILKSNGEEVTKLTNFEVGVFPLAGVVKSRVLFWGGYGNHTDDLKCGYDLCMYEKIVE